MSVFCPARAPKRTQYDRRDEWLADSDDDDDDAESDVSSDCAPMYSDDDGVSSDGDELEMMKARAAARSLSAPQAMQIYRDELVLGALGEEQRCERNADARVLYRNPTMTRMHEQLAHSAARLAQSEAWRLQCALERFPFAALFTFDPSWDLDDNATPLVPFCEMCARDRHSCCRLVLWGEPRARRSLGEWAQANRARGYDRLLQRAAAQEDGVCWNDDDDDDLSSDSVGAVYDMPVLPWQCAPDLDNVPVAHQRVLAVGSWCAARTMRYHAATHWALSAQLAVVEHLDSLQEQRVVAQRRSSRHTAAHRRPLELTVDAQLAAVRADEQRTEQALAERLLDNYQQVLADVQRYARDDTRRLRYRIAPDSDDDDDALAY